MTVGERNEKMNLTGVPETMLQTIYARAKESKGRGAICDKKAEEIVSIQNRKTENRTTFLSNENFTFALSFHRYILTDNSTFIDIDYIELL